MIIEQIDQDLKTAIKEKNEVASTVLRGLKSEIQNAKIAKQADLTEEDILRVIAKKAKQHQDSIESFQKGERSDLVAQEQDQLKLLEKYLPAQMSEEQVRELVKQVIGQTNATSADFGKVMKEVLSQAQGQTNGQVVSKIVKEELS